MSTLGFPLACFCLAPRVLARAAAARAGRATAAPHQECGSRRGWKPGGSVPHIQRTVGPGADGLRWDSSQRCLVGDSPFAALCVDTSRDLPPQPKAEDGEAAACAVKWRFLWLELVSITCPAGSKSRARPHRMSPNSSDTPGSGDGLCAAAAPGLCPWGGRLRVLADAATKRGYFAMVSSHRGLFPPLVTKGTRVPTGSRSHCCPPGVTVLCSHLLGQLSQNQPRPFGRTKSKNCIK